MHPPGADVVVVRHGEVGVKSDQVRMKMEFQLQENLNALLADRDLPGDTGCQRNRLYIRTEESAVEDATAAAVEAPGVVSASPARSVEPTLDAITEALAETARACHDGGPFAVEARRAGNADAHDFSSRDLESEGGQAIWDAIEDGGGTPEVDLDDPEFTTFVDCRPDEAFVFVEKRAGPGGLPLGTQQPLVALVSGGIDSPVAAWQVMARGAPILPVYVDLGDYGGADHRARAETTVAALARRAPNFDLQLRVVDGGRAVEELVAKTDATRMLSLRRFMYRAAETVAREHDAVGIVSGEAIGQKSSQTTANLAATDVVTDLPIHRPLLTMDKTDIIERARELGTYDDATVPAGCNRVAPSRPETAGTPMSVVSAEPEELLAMAESAARDPAVVDVRAYDETPVAGR
ncbi:putative tRNA sulfurtransferase protein [Halorhabdus tiamatea SARL4B]|uniref:Probable tRNA sulfurtransferase n=1 Tax=Halorhabdus tiamatea SARL4B TaxID=1033806 RepID=F7PIM3_9EURY|nr:tRNA sulfurtransferase [Halorhabdus tiamatea]ERJ07011.1 putative tRNA sulfurtransferase protein [Halorhabdus tiamatea SARL4B]CCQ34781.1 tRNA S(4)U 4-thiouridine synthase (former ThiI) [Halorhabdus tiamatea SARL4B]